MTSQRRCQLAAQNQMGNYRVYKVVSEKNAQRPVHSFFGSQRTFRGAWRVAFMHCIVACGNTFEQAVSNAQSVLKEANSFDHL